MKYSVDDVMEYVEAEDVKFIRLAFCDLNGNLKNASIMPSELRKAFSDGIAFDGSAIEGFEAPDKSDLFLFPDPTTLTLLPWRPMHGKVIRLMCDIRYPDGKPFLKDARGILKQAVAYGREKGVVCDFGTEFEFYLFKTDENGQKTDIPCDDAGYMDVAPKDRGENVRREICLTIEEMGLSPECSHHEEGPGQNEIDFKYSDALTSADQAVVFKNATESIAYKNGFFADFSPKPIAGKSGSGLHVNVSLRNGESVFDYFTAGVARRVREITRYLNPTEQSYLRLGEMKAPKKINIGRADRSALIRLPAATGNKRFELRSPDGTANIYLIYALILYAGIEGVVERAEFPEEAELPSSLAEAKMEARNSAFVKKYLPKELIAALE